MKEFTGTTYQEWLDYHRKTSYQEIVDHFLKNYSNWSIYGVKRKETTGE